MSDSPETPDVFRGDAPEVTGSVALVLWTALVRRLVETGALSPADVQAVIADAHSEFSKQAEGAPGAAEAAMALLARLSMNAL